VEIRHTPAWRYCQHDCGHVIAALSYAAAALGWRTRLVEAAADDAVANTCLVYAGRPPAPEMKGNGFSDLNRQTTRGGVTKKIPPNSAQQNRRHRHRFPNYAYPNDPREYIEGEMRAHGFMQGIALCRLDWHPVFDHAQGQQWLRPL
jgi:hypothetical protein